MRIKNSLCHYKTFLANRNKPTTVQLQMNLTGKQNTGNKYPANIRYAKIDTLERGVKYVHDMNDVVLMF